jgi:hypothetical protein
MFDTQNPSKSTSFFGSGYLSSKEIHIQISISLKMFLRTPTCFYKATFRNVNIDEPYGLHST